MVKKPLKKILIVDDDPDALVSLANILKRAGYEVTTTASGKEAFKIAMKTVPDLIVLDIVLPDMGGGEVGRMLAENPSTCDIPIIFLSGILRKKDEEILESRPGKNYVVAKPATSSEILAIVEKIVFKTN